MVAIPRNSVTLGALVLIGLAASMRSKAKDPPQVRTPLPLDSWVEREEPPAAPATAPAPEPPPRRGGGKQRLGKVLIVLGVLLLAYSGTVVFWGDPATGLYARWKQHQLATELDNEFESYASTADLTPAGEDQPRAPTKAQMARFQRERVETAANRLNGKLKMGKPLGRIEISRLGVNAVFVQGTRWGPDLSQGPGHYAQTSLPGVGRTMAIAAHRTTFGAWFRHIDSLKNGDRISLRLPYATFHYRVFTHKIVKSGDWSIIRDRGFDTLVLSACHPLYSASHRWVVFANLVRVDPLKGTPYLVNRRNEVRPLGT